MAESGIFWDTLIELIEESKIVPVVGPDLLTVEGPDGPKPFRAHLGEQLAEYLDVAGDNLPPGGELNAVACRYLAGGNQIEDIYPALKVVASRMDDLPIPEPLLQLSDIRPLKLFVTTSFDSFLVRALNKQRFAGQEKTTVLAHSPTEVDDLPGDIASLDAPVVYYLLGRLAATPDYAVTQEDMVEFFHSLQSETRQPPLLFDELNNQSLLILGSRFSGWLARFFMRMAKGRRLSARGRQDYIADLAVSTDEQQVLFLKSFSRATKIYRSGSSIDFVRELHQRWREKHPEDPAGGPATTPAESSEPELEAGAVFLSYASEDREAAERIKNVLEEAGVDVFFDREQLEPGDDWETKLRRSIRQCSVFLAVLSQQTLTPRRRFFRVEWDLAFKEARKASFSDDAAFLIPVCIDDTNQDDPNLPEMMRKSQWASLPGGQPTGEFVRRVRDLYRRYQKSMVGAS